MNIEERMSERVLVVSVSTNRIDASVAGDFKTALAAVTSRGTNRFVLDMSKVNFMDSSGLGAIVGILKLAGREGSVPIAGLQPAVATLFKVTRMDKVFKIFPTEADAVAFLRV
jgi:anti-sigma B factor antagonist